ncbi:MAG: glycosyltransferase family 4 protein [Nitrosospira sp.]|nr:glycosyltransferase family 4 protein [Nitrosospira sp.]
MNSHIGSYFDDLMAEDGNREEVTVAAIFTGDSRRHRRLQRAVLALYRHAFGRCTRVLFQNPDDRDEFVARRVVDGEKCALVNGSGVDLDVFRLTPLPAGGGTIFLLIARLLGDKGIREYAQAAALVRRSYPEARFWLVGPGDPSPDAISETEVKGWEQSGAIEYFGEAADVLPFLEKGAVYVLPSYREGTPRTVLEAMAVGRPVITTDAPGCRETVADGDNGYLVPVRNVEALAEAMCRFLDNPELIKQMGRRSREIAEERFDVHKVNKQMLAAMGL